MKMSLEEFKTLKLSLREYIESMKLQFPRCARFVDLVCKSLLGELTIQLAKMEE